MDNEQKRYGRSIRDDRDSPEREGRCGDSDRKRKLDKKEENVANKKKSRFCGEKSVAIMELEKKKAQVIEAAKRVHDRAARMGFRQAVAVAKKPTKEASHVLRVDALGREIDEHGHVIIKSNNLIITTLKVNMNNKHKKKDAFHHQLDVDPQENPHFDPRMGNIDKNKIFRPKRMTFQFVEQGKWTRDAENLKLKCQFGEANARELKVKQTLLTKAKDDDINPNLIELSEHVSRKVSDAVDVEWWDVIILTNERHLKIEKLTHYIEHPLPIEPLAEAELPPPQPLKLTKKEQKKLRTQRRVAKEKEKQEMIRQGLLEPPKSKVKMSNLMKVLASEATQDPTKLEKEIRAAAAEREQAHADRNTARKLTLGEKREKKEMKLFDDPATTVGTFVSVYKIKKLSRPETKFKLEMNARQNILTGCSVISDAMSVVVVEGNSKTIKKYKKLMLERINWKEAEEKEEENKCSLIWEGSVSKPGFHRFHVQDCLTESAAKKFFADAGVAQFWDLALNYSHAD